MPELARYLFLAGAAPFLLLGTAHAFATPTAPNDRRGLSPRDPQLVVAMARSSFRLTDRTDMWRAWVGFNLSHSLGVVAFAAAILLAGRSQASFDANAAAFLPLAFVVSLGFTWIGSLYWFRTPIAGCGLGTLLLLASWALYGLADPEVGHVVRSTARSSLLLFCGALVAEGGLALREFRTALLRGLAVSHGVHLLFVVVLAAQTAGGSLETRSSPLELAGGALAYGFIFWGAWRPETRAASAGLLWIWIVFMVAYGSRALQSPWPFGLAVALLAGAMLARLRPLLPERVPVLRGP